ncbi:putative PurR-regulated permease PerM [Mesorhizobium soli]|uniref:AI-2E family transporter n=1 Tax=Pseudaminobacter soli (ex Li et al. 2025) TaxID=1295366 RepID=UPI0024735D7F|nr:AI-2E family transporter [Mesorhizobium soli]MDH6230938.1 putative PurR-regulated permease PerM [Mesorhizobium soli]
MANGPAEPVAPDAAQTASDIKLIRALLIGIFALLAIYALYFGRDFFLPVVLACLLTLMLTPIVRFLRRHGIPEPVSATFLVLISVIIVGTAGYLLSGPVIKLIDDAPAIGNQLTERLAKLREPFEKMMNITHQVEQVAESAQEPGVQRVVIAQPGIISHAAADLISMSATPAITFVLSLFLLASGTLFYQKIVQSFTRLSEKKRAMRIVYDIEREISHYLLTITLINVGLGTVIGLGMWAIGMPTPFVWGATAALLNFLPYIGAAMNIALVAVIAIVSFDSLLYAMLAPLFVVCCNIIEGQFVTPMIVGRRLEINAVSIFVAVAFWSWLWGLIGALIAVPLLVVIKVFCDHLDGLRHVGNFLAAEQTVENGSEEEERVPAK